MALLLTSKGVGWGLCCSWWARLCMMPDQSNPGSVQLLAVYGLESSSRCEAHQLIPPCIRKQARPQGDLVAFDQVAGRVQVTHFFAKWEATPSTTSTLAHFLAHGRLLTQIGLRKVRKWSRACGTLAALRALPSNKEIKPAILHTFSHTAAPSVSTLR
eukprot:1160512-Pelagomonas_calceolata.AAC.8